MLFSTNCFGMLTGTSRQSSAPIEVKIVRELNSIFNLPEYPGVSPIQPITKTFPQLLRINEFDEFLTYLKQYYPIEILEDKKNQEEIKKYHVEILKQSDSEVRIPTETRTVETPMTQQAKEHILYLILFLKTLTQ